MRRWVVIAVGPIVLAHCTRERAAEPALPSVVAVEAVDAGTAPAPSSSALVVAPVGVPASAHVIPGDCRAAAADATKRSPSMKPSWEPIDLDRDGTPDCMFRSCTSARCRTLLYLVERGQVRLVGDLTTSILNEPRCVDATPSPERTASGLCRLSVHVLMIHGDEQEYFYEYSNGAYVEVGVGRRTGPER